MEARVEAWPFDLPGDPEYPMYLRGQAEEVLPGVLSPMMSSIGAPVIERGWRLHMVETMGIIDEPAAAHTFLPVFGGRAYMNLSVSARSAAMSLGVRAEDFAEQFAAGQEFVASASARREGDDERAARLQALMARYLQEPPADLLAADRSMAVAHRREGTAARATTDSAALLERVARLAPDASQCLARVMLVGTLGAMSFGALNKGLAEHLGGRGPQLSRELLSGIGDVESALPAQRLTTLAALAGDELRRALGEFLEEFGHRGANEFEIAAPSWEMAPEAVERMVVAARSAPRKVDAAARASATLEELRRDGLPERWPDFEDVLRNASFYVGARERSKDSFVLVYNEMRLDLVEIGRRLVDDGRLQDRLQVFLLSVDELGHAVSTGEVPDVLDHRAEQMAQLAVLVAPDMVKAGEVPPLDEWERAVTDGDHSAMELHGVAGSSGVARGRVRVVLDPYEDEPPEPGEVLVAPMTDPGWTLMFMAAEAVVVEVGGMLSHAVVVARELGIPAVVSVPNCCTQLRTGDLVEVDGDAGLVRVLERS